MKITKLFKKRSKFLTKKKKKSLWYLEELPKFVFQYIVLFKLRRKEYKNLRVCGREVEYPAVDIFVTTADPMLEPPIITVNTVLSLMALDYPSNKLSCYVSDDGCSPLTFYALNEALNFAKIWIPFCKKYDVQVRAPFMYFSTPPHHLHSSTQFQYDWKTLKVIIDHHITLLFLYLAKHGTKFYF